VEKNGCVLLKEKKRSGQSSGWNTRWKTINQEERGAGEGNRNKRWVKDEEKALRKEGYLS